MLQCSGLMPYRDTEEQGPNKASTSSHNSHYFLLRSFMLGLPASNTLWGGGTCIHTPTYIDIYIYIHTNMHTACIHPYVHDNSCFVKIFQVRAEDLDVSARRGQSDRLRQVSSLPPLKKLHHLC